MVRKILIFIGAIIILTLLLAWGYLLLLGTPQSVQDVFSDLGLRNGGTQIVPEQNIDTTVTLAHSNDKLVQLSTKAVAGFTYVPGNENASGTPMTLGRLRYAEKGTGHIYEIDLSNNTETKTSSVTVGQTIDAIFSPAGEVVILRSEKGEELSVKAYLSGANTTKTIELPDNSENFYFSGSTTVRYSVKSNNSTQVYQKNLLNEADTLLFSVPFTEANIVWTERGTYVINKPAAYLKSGIYFMGTSGLERVVKPQYDLSAFIDHTGRYIVYSALEPMNGRVVGHILDRDTNIDSMTTLFAVPEKCALIENLFWCATSFLLSDGQRGRINEWYSGELSSSDTLWQQAENGASTHVDYLAELAGFDVDVTDLVAASEIDKLFFRNKLNDTLWVYSLAN